MRIHLNLTTHLTDELLGFVLTMGSCIHTLSVDGLRLQSEQHCKAAWPWRELRVNEDSWGDLGDFGRQNYGDPCTTNTSVFHRLPDASGCSVAPVVRCSEYTVDVQSEVNPLSQMPLPSESTACCAHVTSASLVCCMTVI